MRCFIMTWHPFFYGVPPVKGMVNRQTILDKIDTISPIVLNWRANIGAIFLASEHDAKDIAEAITRELPGLMFVISEMNIKTTHGWADKATWDFITDPKHVGSLKPLT